MPDFGRTGCSHFKRRTALRNKEQEPQTSEPLVEPSTGCYAGARKSDWLNYRSENLLPGERKTRACQGIGGPASECARSAEAWHPARPGGHSQHSQRCSYRSLVEVETEAANRGDARAS